MKLMTFNIFGADGATWSKRVSGITNMVSNEKPDILFMQEVYYDERHQMKNEINMGEQLNKYLNYKNILYDIAEQGVFINVEQKKHNLVYYGLLCLTDLPILEHRIIHLHKEDQDKHHRIIQIVKVLYLEKEILFYNVHYSNSVDWSRLHLIETKDHMLSKKETPIILGDLNILDPNTINEILGHDYQNSYEFKKYTSYPSKSEVLDYIILPKKLYTFKNVSCNYDSFSDHRPIIADIEMK